VPDFEQLLQAWDGETAVIHRDRPSGGWMFVCVHSTRLGPSGGGTRLRVYDTPADGLADAMRLSRAMTGKLAIAGMPFGGGKGVIAVPEIPPAGPARRELFLRYGSLVGSLGGTYLTSSDMNTGEPDMDVIGERTRYVLGRSTGAGGSGGPAPPTAIGVFHAIRAGLAFGFGSPDLAGRSVLIQGAGGVGSALAGHLGRAGADVLVADVDADRAAAVAASSGGRVVDAGRVADTVCDVFSPCAVGGVLDSSLVAALRCRMVIGSANNQLAAPSVADELQARGILYAPDYVASGGGVISVCGLEELGWSAAELDAALVAIGDRLGEIFRRAAAEGSSTTAVADAMVAERLA
jgi:leucine dehydrogenase